MKSNIFALIFLLSQSLFAQTALEDFLFNTDKVTTDSILIQKEGVNVLERYNNGYTAAMPHLLWSTSKSVASTILAAAIQGGIISLDESVCQNIQDPSIYSTCDIKIRDLLSWSSGVEWNEGYENDDPTKSSVVQMLAGDGKFDMFGFLLSHPLAHAPGSHFSYSTGDSTAMMGALKLALTKAGKNSINYPWTALFEPLGITQAAFEQDRSGTFIGGAFAYMTPRDLVKIGALYAQNGKFGDKQILPEWWTKFALSTIPSFDSTSNDYFLPQYSWWRFNPKMASKEIPADTFVTLGHWGQFLVVIPSKKIIAVRFGDDRDTAFNLDKMIVLILKQFDEASMPNANFEEAATSAPVYKTPLAGLGTHHVAKIICSCLFVTKQSEAYCVNYGRTNPNIAKTAIDYTTKSVESTFAGFSKAKAVFIDEHLGCKLVQ